MSPQHDIFTNAIEHFAAEQEEIRTAAAFAAGARNHLDWLITGVFSLLNPQVISPSETCNSSYLPF
jgi:hypothetical protein